MELAGALERALACHREGRLAEAEAAYRGILEREPSHPDALHLLGLIEHQRGNAATAAELIGRAIACRPDAPHFHNSLGTVLRASGRAEDAIAAFVRAVALRPDYGEAHYNLGNALRVLERGEEAEAAYRRALEIRRDDPAILNNLATLLQEAGRYAEAESALRLAHAGAPDDGEVAINLATVLTRLGRAADAVALLKDAVDRAPAVPELHAAIGRSLAAAGRDDEAEAAYRRALALDADNAPAATALAGVLMERGRAVEAVPLLRRVAERHGDDVDAHTNLIKAYLNAGQAQEAVAAYRQLVTIHPDNVDVHAHFATCLLLTGDLAEGFAEFEWRWRTKALGGERFSAPRWDGTPMPRSTLLLHAEQGMGDAIQFIRYAPLVAPRVGRLVVETYPALDRLFETVDGIDAVALRGEPPPAFDSHLPLVSLPHFFGTTLATIPAAVPYLRVPDQAKKTWRGRIANGGRPRVGLVWAGSRLHPNDPNRSCPARLLAPLLEIANIDFYSLQTGEAAATVSELGAAGGVRDLAPHVVDFADTAAALSELDLLISVDTAPVHLAGALARPVWVLLPRVPDWRWLLGRDDSPWYPTARLFRQEKTGDWSGVIARVRAALAEAAKEGIIRSAPLPLAREGGCWCEGGEADQAS